MDSQPVTTTTLEPDQTVYALNTTAGESAPKEKGISRDRRRTSAVKLHILLDLRGSIPTAAL
jgi:hypothetical protein